MYIEMFTLQKFVYNAFQSDIYDGHNRNLSLLESPRYSSAAYEGSKCHGKNKKPEILPEFHCCHQCLRVHFSQKEKIHCPITDI